jgi:DNA-binding IclR family transcriptional regulator
MRQTALAEREGIRYEVVAVRRALAVLELLSDEAEPQGVSSIAKHLGIPKSSCLGLLVTLEAAGYARRDERNKWSPTLRSYYLGMNAVRNLDLLNLARPILERIRDETSLTAHLGIFEGGVVRYALKVEPGAMVRFDTYPGKVASLHLTALARAVTAYVHPAELDALLDGYSFAGGTPRAAASAKRFRMLLREVHERGFAHEDEEETSGVSCIAAPIFGERGVRGALGLTGLAAQIEKLGVDRLGELLKNMAASLSASLGAGQQLA